MNVLKADSIVHSFGSRKILTDIFLSLQTGEIVGLLGRNGSGKSTLLKIIFGSLKADYGVVKVNDIYLENAYTKKLVAYLPQHDFLPKDITVNKVVSVFIEGSDGKYKVLSNEYIKRLHKIKVGRLSGGELRLLEILLVLAVPRPFVFLDEPFTGLSPLYRELISTYLQEAKEDRGIIVTDHDYHNIIDISDRLILMKNGTSIHIDAMDELTDYRYLPDVKQDKEIS